MRILEVVPEEVIVRRGPVVPLSQKRVESLALRIAARGSAYVQREPALCYRVTRGNQFARTNQPVLVAGDWRQLKSPRGFVVDARQAGFYHHAALSFINKHKLTERPMLLRIQFRNDQERYDFQEYERLSGRCRFHTKRDYFEFLRDIREDLSFLNLDPEDEMYPDPAYALWPPPPSAFGAPKLAPVWQ